MTKHELTDAMRRELENIAARGEPTDPYDWLDAGAPSSLWFFARDKVLSALIRRALIEPTPDGFALTDAGRAALEGKDK